jgi:flavin prenyltransferase
MSLSKKTITVALTGASGMPYGIRLLEILLQQNQQVYLLYSQAAQIVAHQEMGLTLPSRPKEAEAFLTDYLNAKTGSLKVFGREEWFAPVASGSNPADAMVICPCTMGTLSAVATGLSQKLIERAADVMLKEQRKLIIVPREMPFSTIHLENMLKLSKCGAIILPPNPGFYYLPKTIQDIVDFVVARILDHLNVTHNLMPRWGDFEQEPLSGQPRDSG